MANRDALRELQQRLAQRLAQAREHTPAVSWLAVQCAGRGLLLPLAQAGELSSMPLLLQVPHTQPWFLGVANLRGALHGVVDLAGFLGWRQERPATGDDAARVLALGAGIGGGAALRIDRMLGLRNAVQLQPLTGAEPADAAPTAPCLGARWQDAQAEPGQPAGQWQELDLAALAQDARFLNIAAGAHPTSVAA